MNNTMMWNWMIVVTAVYELIVIYMYLRDFLGSTLRNKRLKLFSFLTFFVFGVLINIFVPIPGITLLYDFLAVLALSFLFDGDFKTKIFATVLLVAFLVASEIITLFGLMMLGNLDANSVIDEFSNRMLGVIISKTLLLIITKITCRLRKQKTAKMPIFYWISLIVSTMISILTVYVVTMFNLNLNNPSLTILSFVIVSALFYNNIIIFYLFEAMLEKAHIETNNKLLEQQIEYQLNHYKDLEIARNELHTMRHDMKNHLIGISELVRSKDYDQTMDYINSISKSVSHACSEITTGNPVIDSMLNAKSTIAKSDHIEVFYTLELQPGIKIDPVDVCVIFGNALDNAIEACRRLPEGAPRKINIILAYSNNNLICEISNTMNGELKKHGEYFTTSKKNTYRHGLGLKNIDSSVQKYNGTLNLEHHDNIFTLSFVLYNV